MTKILRCPFCATKAEPFVSDTVSENSQGEELSGPQVVCDGCGAAGPICHTRRDAIKFWNCVSKKAAAP